MRTKDVIISFHGDIVSMDLSLTRDLRCMSNQELVQVHHCLLDELSAKSRELLTANDSRVEIADVCPYYIERRFLTPVVATQFRNWWVKPLALVYTDIQEVVLLNADVIPMQDPASVREMPGYKRTDTTFFFDRVKGEAAYFNSYAARGGSRYLRH